MIPILSVNKMREADRITIDKLEGNGSILMEHAGSACVRAILNRFKNSVSTLKVLVIAGKGNNGGDGLVIARQLISRNIETDVVLLSDPSDYTGDALLQYSILRNYSDRITVANEHNFQKISDLIFASGLIIDALFGTGLNSELRGLPVKLIQEINKSEKSVVMAVDIPSGLKGDSHHADGAVVKADVTVTFGTLKICHILKPAKEFCGEVIVDDITIPESVITGLQPDFYLSELSDIVNSRPDVKEESHKGSFGHVGVIGGEPGKLGASVMSGFAALKTGSGLSSVFLNRQNYNAVCGMYPELMFHLYDDENVPEQLNLFLKNKDALLVGPGLGISEQSKKIILHILEHFKKTIILDADFFSLFNENEFADIKKTEKIILTPHPGEMGCFKEMATEEIQYDRAKSVKETSIKTGCVTVLKGYQTLISDSDGIININPTGNPGMATAGSGDVLAGIILSLAGQGYSAKDSAVLGVLLHGAAGDRAMNCYSRETLTATGIIENLTEILRD